MTERITIPDAVKQMLAIVQQLREAYPKKRFTLDGRLVGDIGEILAGEVYDIDLFKELQKHHDGTSSDGRLVQIKATMQKSLTFPCDHTPDYYIGIKIHPDGTFDEIFNGPGSIAGEAIQRRSATKNNLHSIAIGTLVSLSKKVAAVDRIPRRGESL